MKVKDPNAVALGRKGGKVKGPSKARPATASRSAKLRWILRPRDVTAESLHRAYRTAASRVLRDDTLSAAAADAGLILSPDPRGSREGIQVFVKAVRFSEARLLADLESGGLESSP